MGRYEKPVVVVPPPKKATLYQVIAKNLGAVDEVGTRNELNYLTNAELAKIISNALEEK